MNYIGSDSRVPQFVWYIAIVISFACMCAGLYWFLVADNPLTWLLGVFLLIGSMGAFLYFVGKSTERFLRRLYIDETELP